MRSGIYQTTLQATEGAALHEALAMGRAGQGRDVRGCTRSAAGLRVHPCGLRNTQPRANCARHGAHARGSCWAPRGNIIYSPALRPQRRQAPSTSSVGQQRALHSGTQKSRARACSDSRPPAAMQAPWRQSLSHSRRQCLWPIAWACLKKQQAHRCLHSLLPQRYHQRRREARAIIPADLDPQESRVSKFPRLWRSRACTWEGENQE